MKSVRAAKEEEAGLAKAMEMDAENAKRLSDESKALAAKKKLAAKAAVRAAESASKAAILVSF